MPYFLFDDLLFTVYLIIWVFYYFLSSKSFVKSINYQINRKEQNRKHNVSEGHFCQ